MYVANFFTFASTNQSQNQIPDATNSMEPTLYLEDNLGGFDDTVGLEDVRHDEQPRDDDANPYIQNDMTVILSRPRQLITVLWSDTQTVGTSVTNFYPFRSLCQNTYNGNIINKYRFFRADLKIRIMLQSTMMHYGKLMVSWLPIRKTNDALPDYRALFALDVNIIDAAKPDVLELTIPFMSPVKWFLPPRATTGDGNALGPQVFINVLAPLGNAQSATASVPITIFAEFVNPKLAGPIENANNVSGEFVIYQSTSGSDQHMRVDSERNNVREAVVSTPQFVAIRHMATVGQSLEEDTTVRLAMSSANLADTSKKMVQSLVPNEHNLMVVCRRPSLLSTVQITTVSPVDIFDAPCIPTYAPGNDPVLTNLQIVSRLARFWNGSMKYLFMFTTAHVSTLRVAAYISYDQLQGPMGEKPFAIWDITGSMNKEVEVPFLSHQPYIPTWHGDPKTTNAGNFGIPSIKLKIINQLTNGSVSTVAPSCYMNVFVAAGENFKLFVPMGYSSADTAKMTPVFSQDNLGLLFAKPFEVLGKSGEPVHPPDYNFGEELIDIMDILHRYTTITPVAGNEYTREQAMIPLFRNMYRFRRYGCRFKILDVTSSARAEWKLQATYDGSSPADFYTHPPWDIVPYTERVPLQVEVPFNECWYYDTRNTYVYSAVSLLLPDTLANRKIHTALSADSVLSFPQWAVAYDNTP